MLIIAQIVEDVIIQVLTFFYGLKDKSFAFFKLEHHFLRVENDFENIAEQNKQKTPFFPWTYEILKFLKRTSRSPLLFFVICFSSSRSSYSVNMPFLPLGKKTYSLVFVFQYLCLPESNYCWFPWEILPVIYFFICYSWLCKNTFWNTEWLF